MQPLVCLDTDGNKFSNIEMGKGEASLWLEEFRGEVTATMVYDGQPVHDHFKKIDDAAVIGIMNGKGVLDHDRYFIFSIWNGCSARYAADPLDGRVATGERDELLQRPGIVGHLDRSSNPAGPRNSGRIAVCARSSTYSANGCGASISRPTATA